MSELKITVVTAVYNGEEYIEECIKSIMNQTYQNFEHIIMDGGSTDNTLEIAKKYEKLYNVKIYSRKDNGMYDAIANGFELATGDILCWLNSDDMLMPWAFEVMQKVISETKAQWCMGFPTYWNDNNVSRCQFRIEFMGIAYTEEDLYAHVLAMEQIMSTGGGWQDQVGGITPGLKYITSMPGIDQKLKVTHVEIPEAAKQELSDRFVLIYTGQRRLARNLLRDVVGRYVGNEPESLFALEEIQKTAALMRFELERGNVDGFASLLDYHWELSKKVDAGSSNTLIEQIFSSIEELIDGKLVCGAGGGGFLQVILKKGVTRQQVEERLNEVFMDSLVGVADCRLVWE